MSLEYNHKLIPRAKAMRKEATKQEDHLWYDYLAHYPIRFQRQKVIDNFIADFYCYKAKLIIEIDGSQHYNEQGIAYDTQRSAILESMGLKVLRFTNMDVDRRFAHVCEFIDRVIKERIQ